MSTDGDRATSWTELVGGTGRFALHRYLTFLNISIDKVFSAQQ